MSSVLRASIVIRGEPDKKKAVTSIAVTTLADGPSLAAIARLNGEIDLLTSTGISPFLPAETIPSPGTSTSICGLSWLLEGPSPLPSLISCTSSGLVRRHTIDPSFLRSSATGSKPLMKPQHTSFQTCSNASSMAVDSSGRYVAVGGESCNVVVWDLLTSKEVFKAKGGKPDKLGLVDKVNCTALAFLTPPAAATATTAQGSKASTASKDGDEKDASPPPLTLVSGTASHKVYVYELAAGRRPQLDLPFGETRVTALAPDPVQGLHCWAANGQGIVERLDVESKMIHGGMKGSTGSVRALSALSLTLGGGADHDHEEASKVSKVLPIVASVGLDRYLRVFHASTRKCLHKIYLKQQLTAVAICQPRDDHQPGPGGVTDPQSSGPGGVTDPQSSSLTLVEEEDEGKVEPEHKPVQKKKKKAKVIS